MGTRAFQYPDRPVQILALNGDGFWIHEKKASRWEHLLKQIQAYGWFSSLRMVFHGFRDGLLVSKEEGL
jgi:hypothetical protein